jgi:hypothetical protein
MMPDIKYPPCITNGCTGSKDAAVGSEQRVVQTGIEYDVVLTQPRPSLLLALRRPSAGA